MIISSPFGEDPASADPSAARITSPNAGPEGRAASSQTRSLYRKYRPQSFDADELVGQEHVVRTLRNAISLNRVAHAYLFCGPRGTGKTTTARILAKAVNCLDSDVANRPCNVCANCRAISSGAATDVIEIDAASNRGIDDIRELRERVKYAPTQLGTKFYIIDEAHQITGAAANAFLKTLEEPPGHTKFILATTDPEELLPTIVSRCQRFDFRRIGAAAIVSRLRTVAESEGLRIENEALQVIARHAAGSLRDALGLLDQLAVYGDCESDDTRIDATAVRTLLGVSRNDRVELLATALADRDAALALGTVNAAVEAGEDPRQLNRQLVAYLRILLHQRAGGSPDADDRAKDLASRFELGELAGLARLFSEVDYKIRHSSYAHLPLEVALVEGVLRGANSEGSHRPASRDTGQQDVPTRSQSLPPSQARAAEKMPTTSLRDRVRGAAATPLSSIVPSPSAPEPKACSPEVATPPPDAAARPANGHLPTVEQLIQLWPRIRLDVKAINRRIEALLSSIDPIAVRGDEIVLAAAYACHRDRMNTDEVRAVVEDVIGRTVNQRVRTTCVLRSEDPGRTGALSATSEDNSLAQQIDASSVAGAINEIAEEANVAYDPSLDERRITAAKNIFDAEEVTS
jgi:DNA polymerase-3 subunit gamma/tau